MANQRCLRIRPTAIKKLEGKPGTEVCTLDNTIINIDQGECIEHIKYMVSGSSKRVYVIRESNPLHAFLFFVTRK